ncbi:MAG: hypothetical protein JXA11_00900 [Phycisphaerae bacterium]|nr:hypothetical protein [Phycisphaerae bacterium]
MNVSPCDIEILQRLGEQYAKEALQPMHAERMELWRKLNDLESVRPMVWLYEIPWHEMNVDDELTLRCEDAYCREIERELRRELYRCEHIPGDMVMPPHIACRKVWGYKGPRFGIDIEEEILPGDPTSDVVAHKYISQISEPGDLEKIKTPKVYYDAELTKTRHEFLRDVFDGILPVVVAGVSSYGLLCPADNVFMWWGLQQAMMDLILKPDMMKEAIRRTARAYMSELDQIEELGLLDWKNTMIKTGSGGYCYCKELPGEGYDPRHVTPSDMWGGAAAQIFAEISPEMHWEFVLQYELPLLKRFGMTYYGCCEPLHNKIDMLRKIPNLRKISISPRADAQKAAKQIGRDYVISLKPNPAILAENRWRPEEARKVLRENLERTRGCNVEIIMKDISTVRYEPRRLWEWVDIAGDLAKEFAP